MNFSFKLKGKKITIPVRECRSLFSQMQGLMFSEKTDVLLFIFKKKTRQPIHSFFCKKFVAIWFRDKEIVDVRAVNPWRFSVKPKQLFDTLLEIPVGNQLYNKILDGMRKI
ncbi:MAG: hypothetical protein RL557_653 [archaeon]|jgi:uncharacterized membrane protein (UPF0127 family)